MIRVIGVRFRTAGKIYYFDPGKLEIKKNDHVIVETARGIEYGTVVGDPKEEPEEDLDIGEDMGLGEDLPGDTGEDFGV
jgi:cell fate regulator YaaT (PSP1 superfamily)